MDRLIVTKINTVTQIWFLKRSSHHKFEFLKILDGGGRHFGKSVKSQYRRKHIGPILTKFDKVTCIGTTYAREHLKSQFKKFKIAEATILKNRKIAISQQRINGC